MKISSAKAKGRSFQQKICVELLSLFPSLTADDVRTCPMASHGEDIQLSPAAQALFPYAIEAKARKSVAAYKWLTQACGHGRTPLLFMKGDRQPTMVVLFADDFYRLLKGGK